MPHLDWVTLAFWILTASAQATVLGAMVLAQSWRRWPSLFAFLLILNIREVTLAVAVMAGSNFAYFWCYWILGAIAQVAELFVILEICRCLVRGTARLERFVARAVPAGSIVVMVITAILAITDDTPGFYKITAVVQRWDVAVCLGWLVVFLGVILGSRGAGIQWSHGAREIGVGFLIETVSTTISSLFILYFHRSVALGAVRGVIYIATLTIWLLALLRERRKVSLRSRPSSFTRIDFKKGLLGQ